MKNLFFNLPDELQIRIMQTNPHPLVDLLRVTKNSLNKKTIDVDNTYRACYSKKDMCDGYYNPVTNKFYTFSEFYFDAIKLKMALRRFKQKNKLTK